MKPRVRSCQRNSWRLEKTLAQVSVRPSVLRLSPNNGFSCDDAMVMAAAEVNPLMTGWEMKLMRNPVSGTVRSQVWGEIWIRMCGCELTDDGMGGEKKGYEMRSEDVTWEVVEWSVRWMKVRCEIYEVKVSGEKLRMRDEFVRWKSVHGAQWSCDRRVMAVRIWDKSGEIWECMLEMRWEYEVRGEVRM